MSDTKRRTSVFRRRAWINKCVRTLKVNIPELNDLKHFVQRTSREARKRPHEIDFGALKYFDPPGEEKDFLFIDVGANRGQTISSVRMYRNYRILSIEPNVELADRLRRRYRGDSSIEIISKVASDNVQPTTIYMPIYKRFAFDGLASMDYEEARGWLTPDKIFGFDERHLRIASTTVESIRIDDMNLAPGFLKADVQGAELVVIRGAEATIRKHAPVILLERPHEDREVPFLRQFGYEPYMFTGHRFAAGVKKTVNTFFLKPQHRGHFRGIPFDGVPPGTARPGLGDR